MPACPACATANPETGKFCTECGTPLRAVAARPSERRQLTVLFCDLVGSTNLSARLDPEEYQEAISAYQAVCGQAIRDRGGYVAQLLGDGVLAYFGYPTAHEDDARRAIGAALQIVEQNGAIRAGGDPIQVRAGIHTGVAVIGGMQAAGREEQLALGETPNVAARIQAEAYPNAVLVSESTFRLAKRYFDFERLEPRRLKGFPSDTSLFRVRGEFVEGAEASTPDVLTAFTGRLSEMESLRRAWHEVLAGAGRVVEISGEPGLGKSRLLDELKADANASGALIGECRCSAYHTNTAFFPVATYLGRRLALHRETSETAKVEKLQRWLLQQGLLDGNAVAILASMMHMESVPPPVSLTAGQVRLRTIELLVQLLAQAGKDGPVLLVLEDLHWADPSTIELFDTLFRGELPRNVLVAASYRPEFRPPWPRREEGAVLELGPVPPGEAEILIRRVAGDLPISPQVVERIQRRAEGVPLFLEEVTRAVLETGEIADDAGPETPRSAENRIPASVRDSLTARMDRLGEARQVLRIAAVIGREFDYRMILSVAGVAEQDLREALTRLEEARLVFRSGEPPAARYVIKHALIQDAAYGSLVRKVRQQYHQQVAERLEQQYPELAGSQPEVLAAHYESAASWPEALRHWMSAGGNALQRAANREAIAHLDGALRVVAQLPASPERSGHELNIHLASMAAKMAVFGWSSPDVEACCVRARDISLELGNYQTLYGATYGIWTVHFVRAEFRKGEVVARQLKEMAAAAGDPFTDLTANHAFGFTAFFLGDYATARAVGEDRARRLDMETDRQSIAAFQMSSTCTHFCFLEYTLFLVGDPRHAWAGAEYIRLLAELDHPPTYGLKYGFGIYLLYTRQDIAAIRETVPKLLALCREQGFVFWEPIAQMFRAYLEFEDGDASAIERIRAAIESKTGSRNVYTCDQLLLARALLKLGRLQEAWDEAEKGIEWYRQTDLFLEAPELHRLRGEILWRQNDVETALEEYEQAVVMASEKGAWTYVLRAGLEQYDRLASIGRKQAGLARLEEIQNSLPPAVGSPDLERLRCLLQRVN